MNQPQLWPAQPQYSSKLSLPRTNGRILVKILLYFVGTPIAWFGFFAGTLVTTGSNGPFGCFALSFSLLALIGSIFIFFQKKYYVHCLPGLQYLWWILGATAISFAAFVIVFGFTGPNTNRIGSALVCYIIFFYGISLMWIAHLKPPVAQQVNESVYRILKKMPGKQIGMIDLLARLQKEYKQLGSTINQYLENIEYIEQISIPEAPGIVCCMKQPKLPIATPKMQPVPISTPYPQTASVLQSSHMPVRQIPQPLVVRTNAPQSIKPNDAFFSIADQETATALPLPNQVPPSQPTQGISSSCPKPTDVSIPPPSQPVPSPSFSPAYPKPSTSLKQERKAIQIFCCYAYKDEQRLKKLKAHLKPQQRQGLVHIWHDRDINAGAEWEKEIEEQLNTSQIVLFLVSADFMDSDYCYTKEMEQALERHRRGEVRAIPIILRPTDWQITPLGKLQALPKNGKPITTWSNQDDAYLDVARGIRTVVETLLTSAQQPKKEEQAPSDYQKAGSGHREPDTNMSHYLSKYTIKNDGPIQGQVVGERVSVSMHFGNSQEEYQSLQGGSGNQSDHPRVSHYQNTEAEVILVRTRCTQGNLIVTNRKIVLQLSALGQTIKSQTLLTASLSSIDSKLAVPALLGKGGGVNLTFHGKGKEVLNADLVPIKEAKEIIALLS